MRFILFIPVFLIISLIIAQIEAVADRKPPRAHQSEKNQNKKTPQYYQEILVELARSLLNANSDSSKSSRKLMEIAKKRNQIMIEAAPSSASGVLKTAFSPQVRSSFPEAVYPYLERVEESTQGFLETLESSGAHSARNFLVRDKDHRHPLYLDLPLSKIPAPGSQVEIFHVIKIPNGSKSEILVSDSIKLIN